MVEIWILSVCLVRNPQTKICNDDVRTIQFSHQRCTRLENEVIKRLTPAQMSGYELQCRQMEVKRVDELPPPSMSKKD